jgi:hypothetical protein
MASFKEKSLTVNGGENGEQLLHDPTVRFRMTKILLSSKTIVYQPVRTKREVPKTANW